MVIKMKNVHPMTGSGLCMLVIFNISISVEIITGLPIMSQYIQYVTLGAIFPSIIVYDRFNSKYDPEDGESDGKLFFLGILLAVLLGLLIYTVWT